MLLYAALLALTFQRPDSISLDEALARARATRGQAAAALASVDRARGTLRVAGLIPNPMLQLETDELAPTRKLTGSQPTSWLLRRGADRAAGRAAVARAQADADQALADVARDVRASFYRAMAGAERLRLAAEQMAIADSLVMLAERRVTAGDISELERDQVVQEAARVRLTQSQIREAAMIAAIDFGRAVAWTGSSLPAPRGTLDAGLDEAIPDEASIAVTEIPLLRAALADSAEAASRLSSFRLAQIPMPALIAGQEWGRLEGGGSSLILGLAVPLPIWNQGREAVAEARGAAAVSAALAAEARMESTARLAVARLRLRESRERARVARDSLQPAARRLREGAIRLYESGRSGILPVFDAVRSERETAQLMIQELLAFQEARADLAALLGRWE